MSLFDPLAAAAASAASIAGKFDVARPEAHVKPGNLAGTLQAALRQELASAAPDLRKQVLAQFAAIQTHAQAADFLGKVRAGLKSAQKA